MLTNREKSDLEVIHRLFGIERLLYDEEDDVFFAKARKLNTPSFIVLDPKDFISLEKKTNSIIFLLQNS